MIHKSVDYVGLLQSDVTRSDAACESHIMQLLKQVVLRKELVTNSSLRRIMLDK